MFTMLAMFKTPVFPAVSNFDASICFFVNEEDEVDPNKNEEDEEEDEEAAAAAAVWFLRDCRSFVFVFPEDEEEDDVPMPIILCTE